MKFEIQTHRFVSDLVTGFSHRTLFFLDNFVRSCIITLTNLAAIYACVVAGKFQNCRKVNVWVPFFSKVPLFLSELGGEFEEEGFSFPYKEAFLRSRCGA